MIQYKPNEIMKDRNGVNLYYGDIVLAKIWMSILYSPCTVVGFTDKYVLLSVNGNSTEKAYRISNNVVKVSDFDKWKLNY